MEAKTFNASIYQLDKTGDNATFEYKLKGTIEDDGNLNKVAEFLGARIYKVLQAQNNILKKAGKHRFFRLATSKPLYFYFQTEGFELNTELFESVKIRLSGIENVKALQTIIREVCNILANTDDIAL